MRTLSRSPTNLSKNNKDSTLNPISAQQAWEVLQQADCLYSPEQVESALAGMASRISQTLAGTDPLLVCVMTGGVVPFGRLLTQGEPAAVMADPAVREIYMGIDVE